MSEFVDTKNRPKRSFSSTNYKNNPELGMGKLPPQAVDLEEVVLGAMLLESNAVNTAIDILKPESFYKDAHAKIYNVILLLFGKGQPIDMLTVVAELKVQGHLEYIGGAFYISQLTNRVASTANIEFHARIIAQKHIQRELIRVSNEIIRDAYEDSTDVFDLLDRAETNLFQVAEGNIRKGYDQMRDVVKEAMANIEAAKNNTDGVSGVPTGFHDLDKITAGWQNSDMIVIAARPGMGKTAFVLSMARNVAVDFGIPVALFSLEMASVQLVQRLIASESEISADKLRKGNLADHETQQLYQKTAKLAEAPIFIDDTPALSVFELRAKCRRLKAQHGIALIIIDYLQLMTAGGEGKGNREQEISTISRSIKGIAKELDVPIIALSQLSRSVETRGGDKKPLLSDLRESGAIEQDADIVSFIYRPEYYGMDEDAEGNPTAGMGQIIVAKHRNGSTGTVNLRFIGRLAKFTNLDSFGETPLYGNAMKPNLDFAEPPTKTLPSKMNDMVDEDFTLNEPDEDNPPF